MQAVFKIKNLQCEYLPQTPILALNDMEVPRGKLIFVIGKSGIGKSTLIETLGLMNNTIAAGADTSVRFFPTNGEREIELKNSWQLPNQQLAEFRRNYFSFIFQNTNLMPNFTAGENMMMSLLIKGMETSQARKEVLQVMGRLSLGSEVFDKKITNLSGGQRQRLAFVRAVTTDFTVLFGDEPTGNLDEITANELMAILKKIIIEEEKTGIIVSHDLALARKFADMIVPISMENREGGKSVGQILPDNIIYRNDLIWFDGKDNRILDPNTHLKQFLSAISIVKS